MDLTIKLLISLSSVALGLTGLIIFSVLWLRHKNSGIDSWYFKYGLDDYPQLLVPTLGLAMALFVLVIVTPISAEQYNETVCDKIVSIEMKNETHGAFVLGTGAIDSETYYFTYEDLGKGQYKLQKFNTDKTFIVETTDTHYYVAHIKNRNEFENNYYIYVPVGTITKEFKL